MNPSQVAAEFAAYMWYEENRATKSVQKEAARFAKENWSAFLPVAHKGWGKLLVRIAKRRTKSHNHKERDQSRFPSGPNRRRNWSR
jgi:hypothetical protein